LLPDIEPDAAAPDVSPETRPALAPAPEDPMPRPDAPPEPAPDLEPERETAPEVDCAPPLPGLEHDTATLAEPAATSARAQWLERHPMVNCVFI